MGSKHALRRSDFPCTLASGLTSLQPSNDVGEKSSSYDEHASGSLFWTQKDPIGFKGHQTNIYVYAGDDPINGSDPSGKDPTACIHACTDFFIEATDSCRATFAAPPEFEALLACLEAVEVGDLLCQVGCYFKDACGSGFFQ